MHFRRFLKALLHSEGIKRAGKPAEPKGPNAAIDGKARTVKQGKSTTD
jgi:hypothetical protein